MVGGAGSGGAGVLRQGPVLRGSSLISSVFKHRLAAVMTIEIITFKTQTGDGKYTGSKRWPFSEGCSLTDPEYKECMVRSRTGGLFSSNYDRTHLHVFSVSWPFLALSGPVSLILGFESEDDARAWHGCISRVITGMKVRHKDGHEGSRLAWLTRRHRHTPSTATTFDVAADTMLLSQMPGGTPSRAGHARKHSTGAPASINSDTELSDDGDGEMSGEGAGLVEGTMMSHIKWATVRRVQGLAIFREESRGVAGAAHMASVVVRAEPEEVFKALMRTWQGPLPHLALTHLQIVGSVDAQSHLLTGDLPTPSSWAASLVRTRRVHVQRSWRQEIDGTYVVMFSSVSGHRGGGGEVEVPYYACGYTVAPVRERCLKKGHISEECQVTMVMKVDPGGFLSSSSVLACVAPFVIRSMEQGYIEPSMLTLYVLRDLVEQDRFVIRPFRTDYATRDGQASENGAVVGMDFADHVSEMARGEALVKTFRGPLTPEQKRMLEYEPPCSLPTSMWSNPVDLPWRVRGPSYLRDRKKQPAGRTLFDLVAVDLLRFYENVTPGGAHHVARFIPWIKDAPYEYMFIVNILIPGIHLVMTWACRDPSVMSTDTYWGKLFDQFLKGTDDNRNGRFKLIPNIPNGSWIVKQAVGSTPVIIGRKVRALWYRTPKYIEVTCDINSNGTAMTATNLVRGLTKSLLIDMAILIEGQSASELPEKVIGHVRLDHFDMAEAVDLDLNKEWAPKWVESESPQRPAPRK